MSTLSDVVLPPRNHFLRRILRQPKLKPYNRLTCLILGINLVVLCCGLAYGGWWSDRGAELTLIATMAQLNFALGVLVRQQHVINLNCKLATGAPKTWPLRIRWALGKYYHMGGLHVGATVSGTLWYTILAGSLTYCTIRHAQNVSVASVVLSYLLVALFLAMVIAALPARRARAHDRFEMTHRFCGWTSLLLVWVSAVLAAERQGRGSLVRTVLATPAIWLLAATTVLTVLPWLRLRKVPIAVHLPSRHVAIVRMHDNIEPFAGSVRSITRNPLLGWHTFGTMPAPHGSPGGYRLAVSRAGDWTSDFIDNPPTHVWVRGVPTAGVANVRKLFDKVLFLATGSGIGPLFAHLLANEAPGHLVWVTRDPRRTYGDELVDEVLAVLPDATIWDTDEQGRPDMLRLAYAEFVASRSDAAICVSNRKVTLQVVHGLECRGIPAFGPIWDS